MRRRFPLRVVAAMFLFLGAATSGAAQQPPPYPNVPPDLKLLVDAYVEDTYTAVGQHGESPDAAVRKIAGRWNRMVLLTVADATATQKLAERRLFVDRNVAETARTDKQVGAGSSGSGSTSLVEKGGIPLLLGYAIEHGAIQQEVNGTSITLSTSPYGLAALAAGGDTADNYKKYNFWTRFGFAATFNVNEGTPSLSTISSKQLTEYSARVRLLGDKSSRSEGFRKLWENTVGKQIQSRVNTVSDALITIYQQENTGTPLLERSDRAITALLAELHRDFGGASTLEQSARADLRDRVLKALYENICLPVRNGELEIPAKTREKIHTEIFPTLGKIEDDLQDARENLDKQLADFYKSAELTFTYTNHRTSVGSDYSEFKWVFERHIAPLDLTVNGGFSIYHHPDATMGQEKVRDAHVSMQLEAHSRSLFKFSENDHSKTIYSLSGRYERMRETKADIGIVQTKIEIPLGAGISLPFSFTYATRTELIDEKEVRGNFGLSFDLDKLYGLLRHFTESGKKP